MRKLTSSYSFLPILWHRTHCAPHTLPLKYYLEKVLWKLTELKMAITKTLVFNVPKLFRKLSGGFGLIFSLGL